MLSPVNDVEIMCVLDLERAISFYEAFFQQKVIVKDEVNSILDIKAGLRKPKRCGP